MSTTHDSHEGSMSDYANWASLLYHLAPRDVSCEELKETLCDQDFKQFSLAQLDAVYANQLPISMVARVAEALGKELVFIDHRRSNFYSLQFDDSDSRTAGTLGRYPAVPPRADAQEPG